MNPFCLVALFGAVRHAHVPAMSHSFHVGDAPVQKVRKAEASKPLELSHKLVQGRGVIQQRRDELSLCDAWNLSRAAEALVSKKVYSMKPAGRCMAASEGRVVE